MVSKKIQFNSKIIKSCNSKTIIIPAKLAKELEIGETYFFDVIVKDKEFIFNCKNCNRLFTGDINVKYCPKCNKNISAIDLIKEVIDN